jgi:hypothetical protein
VVAQFPPASGTVQNQRYQLIRSFINTCQDPQTAIAAKADALANLYARYIPAGLKQKDQYAAGEKFQRSCQNNVYDRAYPLNSGWLLAVAAYNAGPKVVDALAYYNRWSAADLAVPKTFKDFTPADMIGSLYWSGRYNPETDKIDVVNVNGSTTGWLWFKECVVQRHVARVIQHVTQPGIPYFVDTLEGSYPCAKSIFDESGRLIQSKVPPHRQASAGQKPLSRRR